MRISGWSSDVCSSDLPAPAPGASTPAPQPPSTSSESVSASGDEITYVTPLVRRLAQQQGVDLSKITGTGVGGRIRKEDVLKAAEAAAQAPAEAAPAAAPTPAPLEVSPLRGTTRSEEHTSELQSLMRISYAVFCL